MSTTTELTTLHNRLDQLEQAMLGQPQAVVDLPLKHRFTNGMYIREIFMPAGTLCTSKIHNTQHPYVITQGKVSVYIPTVGVKHITAPHFGITEVGTRRVLYIHEDTVWITFHPNPTNIQDLDEIEARIIERRELQDGSTAYQQYKELLDSVQAGLLAQNNDYVGAP